MRKVKRILFLAVVVTTALAGLRWYDRARAEAPAVSGAPIEYDRLANQETDPFMFQGKVMDENHPRWRQYRRAIRKFRDVRDCLIEEEQNRETPNLLLIDWQKTGLGSGAQVCLFLIARSLGTMDRHREWLEFHEFRTLSYSRFVSDGYSPAYETEPVAYLSGTWTTEQYRAKKPSWFASLTGIELVQGYGVSVRYSHKQRVVGATASSHSE
ncbi:hypothetical protein [Profundibacter sp.]